MTAQLTAQDLPTENSSLAEIQEFVKKQSVVRGYHTDIPTAMLFLTEEVGELAKALREHIGANFDEKTSRKDLEDEFHDVLHNLLALANFTNVDIIEAYLKKEKADLNRNWKKLKEEN